MSKKVGMHMHSDYSLSFMEGLNATVEEPALAVEPHLRSNLLEALLLRLHSIVDLDGLWTALQFIIHHAAPGDACTLHLNARGATPAIRATPNAAVVGHCLAQGMRQRGDQSTQPLNLADSSQPKVHQLSDVMFDPRQLPRLELFRKHLAPKRWHHIARMLYCEEARPTAEITILRTADQGRFSDREIALLERLHPHIDATIRRVVALSTQASALRPQHFVFQASALTPAERRLVRLLRTGLSNKEIAHQTHKSVRTVKTQLTNVYRKYGVRSRSRLLALMMTQ